MKLEESIVKADFEKNWLVFTSDEELKIISKDPIPIRWLKYLLQVLFCCFCDVYAHVRINRVAIGIWETFKKEARTDFTCKEKYLALVKNLLESNLEDRRPITTYRHDLIDLIKKISSYRLPNSPASG